MALPFYFDYAKGDRSYFHWIPLYGRHTRGDYYRREFFLGPLFMTARDTQEGTSGFDFLFPLAGRRTTRGGSTTWLLPLYLSGTDAREQASFRYVLPGYWSNQRANYSQQALFPLFGTEDRKDVGERRLALLGFPPIKALDPLPTLSLYERRTKAQLLTDRFFPLYSYSRDAGSRSFGLIGWETVSLFRRRVEKESSATWLFPLYFSGRDDRDDSAYRFVLPGYWSNRQRDDSQQALFPLFGKEVLNGGEERRFSLLGAPPLKGLDPLPTLALYERKTTPSQFKDRFFPLYHYATAKNGESELGVLGVGDGLSLFRRRADQKSSAGHLFPLYSYDRDALTGDRSLGAIGWGPLSLYRQTRDQERFASRFFPLYRYARDSRKGESDWDALFLYRHKRTPASLKDALLPLYHYDRDDATRRKTFALLGLPALGELPVVPSLYVHERAGSRLVDRFFPIYRYADDPEEQTRKLNVLFLYNRDATRGGVNEFLFPLYSRTSTSWETDLALVGYGPLSLAYSYESPSLEWRHLFPLYFHWHNRTSSREFSNALLLYFRGESPGERSHGVFPLYSYAKDEDARSLFLLGAFELSFYGHTRGPDRVSDRFFPLYDYRKNAAESRFSLLGIPHVDGWPTLSLFEHVRSSSSASTRLFPLYSYGYDAKTGESHSGSLLYRMSDSPTRRSRVLFPLFSYAKDKAEDSVKVGVLGVAPFSLYQRVRTPTRTDDRLLGIYHYNADRAAQETETSVLWPLVNYKSGREGSEFSVLWWLVDYVRSSDQTREFRFLGGSGMALFRAKATPNSSKVEFNPIIPFYVHKTEAGRLTEWSVLGFGRCVKEGRARPKALWVCL
jgi:hypothetical protein